MATGMSRPPLDRGLTSKSAFLGTNISGEEFEDLHEQREPVGKAPDFYDQNPLAASDEILETVVDDVKTPEAIRAIRNLLFWRQILGSIEPESPSPFECQACGSVFRLGRERFAKTCRR